MKVHFTNLIKCASSIKKILLMKKFIIYLDKSTVFQLELYKKTVFSFPIKTRYRIKIFEASTLYSFFIAIDFQNNIYFLNRPYFSFIYFLNSRLNIYYIKIIDKKEEIILCDYYKIEVWCVKRNFTRRFRLSIEGFDGLIKNLKTSSDQAYLFLLTSKNCLTILETGKKYAKLIKIYIKHTQLVREINIFLSCFVNNITNKTFYMRSLLEIREPIHIIIWTKSIPIELSGISINRNNYSINNNALITQKKTIKWILRKKFNINVKANRLKKIIVNEKTGILLLLFDSNIILLYEIINLRLMLRVDIVFFTAYHVLYESNNILLSNENYKEIIMVNDKKKNLVYINIDKKNTIKEYVISKEHTFLIILFTIGTLRLINYFLIGKQIYLINIFRKIRKICLIDKKLSICCVSGSGLVINYSILTLSIIKMACFKNLICDLYVDATNEILILIDSEYQILIIGAKNLILLNIIRIHNSRISNLMFVLKIPSIITSSYDKTVKEVELNKNITLKYIYKHEDAVYSFSLLTKNTILLSITVSNIIYLWDSIDKTIKYIISLDSILYKSRYFINSSILFNTSMDNIGISYYKDSLFVSNRKDCSLTIINIDKDKRFMVHRIYKYNKKRKQKKPITVDEKYKDKVDFPIFPREISFINDIKITKNLIVINFEDLYLFKIRSKYKICIPNNLRISPIWLLLLIIQRDTPNKYFKFFNHTKTSIRNISKLHFIILIYLYKDIYLIKIILILSAITKAMKEESIIKEIMLILNNVNTIMAQIQRMVLE